MYMHNCNFKWDTYINVIFTIWTKKSLFKKSLQKSDMNVINWLGENVPILYSIFKLMNFAEIDIRGRNSGMKSLIIKIHSNRFILNSMNIPNTCINCMLYSNGNHEASWHQIIYWIQWSCEFKLCGEAVS